MELEPWTFFFGSLFALALAIAAASFRALRQLPRVEQGTVGFFHPFADGGGGGERVLWCAVRAVQEAAPQTKVLVYVHAGVTAEQLRQDAADRFSIILARPVEVVPLQRTALVVPEHYPRFTLLRQALGSVRLGWEALSQRVPQVFVDTTGWAFTFPLAKLAGCQVACYVHYPTISSNMLGRVLSRQSTYNNDAGIGASSLKTLLKAAYYQAMALVYGLCGAFADVVMVNSSWTGAHIRQLWWRWGEPHLLYPPCDTTALSQLPLDRRLKHLYLVSVAQFRPEKNQRLQLEAYAMARRNAAEAPASHPVVASRLKFVGSCRGAADQALLEGLKQLAKQLEISEYVDWHVNVSFAELRQLLGGAVGGLHSMTDEHFGISVVEYMAAGVIPIAHKSGGPRGDIVVPEERGPPAGLEPGGRSGNGTAPAEGVGEPQPVGFLAESVEEYCDGITRVLMMEQVQRLQIAAAAQRRAAAFSIERFEEGFKDIMGPLLLDCEHPSPRRAGAG